MKRLATVWALSLLAITMTLGLATAPAEARPRSKSTALRVVGVTATTIKLHWPKVRRAATYRIELSTTTRGKRSRIAWFRSTRGTISNLSSSRRYLVRVTAFRRNGTQIRGRYATGTARTAAPGPVASGPRPTGTGQASGWSGGYGMFEDLQYLTGQALSKRLDEYKAVGVQWARFQLLWANVQSGGPDYYYWKPVDDLVEGLVARGIKPIAVIGTTPSWASRATGCAVPTCAPADPAQFAAFASKAAARYAPRGVGAWEIWNEPNLANFWKPSPSARAYTAVLKGAHTSIKAAAPRAVVVTGGLAPAATTSWSIAPIAFFAGIYSNGGQGSFDAVGWHPYTYPRMPGTVDNGDAWYQMYGPANSARAQMAAHGDGAKKIWITEFGAHTNPLGTGYVTEAQQADTFSIGAKLWTTYSWAGPMIGYMLRDRATSTADREDFFGLTRHDGTPKPAYSVFVNIVRAFTATQRGSAS